MPGFGGTVTRSSYNASSKKYDGPDITDPKKDSVGRGYVFQGFLCCCPDKVKVAGTSQAELIEKELKVKIEDGRDSSGKPEGHDIEDESGGIRKEIEERLKALPKLRQASEKAPLISVTYRLPRARAAKRVVVHEGAVSVWTGAKAEWLEDRKGSVAALLKQLMANERPAGELRT